MPTYSVDLFLTVTDHIKAPSLKMLAINKLLFNFNKDPGTPSMKKMYTLFLRKRWISCCKQGSRKDFLYRPEDGSMYPMFVPNNEKCHDLHIYEQDYLNLLLDAYNTYQSVYKFDSIYDIWMALFGYLDDIYDIWGITHSWKTIRECWNIHNL